MGGAFNAISTLLPAVKRAGGGSLIINSTRSGIRGAGTSARIALQRRGDHARQVAAQEAGPHGVRVNVVAPGYIGMQAWMAKLGDRANELAATVRLRRSGRGEDVEGVVAWLFSDSAAHVTGSVIPFDGGTTAGCADHLKDAIEALFGRGWNLPKRTLARRPSRAVYARPFGAILLGRGAGRLHSRSDMLEAYWLNLRRLETLRAGWIVTDVKALDEGVALAGFDLWWWLRVPGAEPSSGDLRGMAVCARRSAGDWRLRAYIEAPLAPVVYMRRLYAAAATARAATFDQ